MKNIGRNDPCSCNSGKQYKKCCGQLETRLALSSHPIISELSTRTGSTAEERKPAALPPILNKATTLLHKRRYQDALILIENAGSGDINNAELLNVAASCAHSLNQYEKAERFWLRALLLKPDYAVAHFNLGILLHDRKRSYEAESCYRQALLHKPDYAEAYNNLAYLLQECQRFDEAEASFRLALALKPGYAKAEWNLGLLLLSLGRFDEGWRCYEARYHPTVKQTDKPRLPYPQWKGQALTGKSLVLWPEQGHGDEIQFCRYIAVIKKLGAKSITLVCKQPLKRLFLSLDGADAVVAQEDAATLPPHDYWALLHSVMLYCGTTLDSIPASLPYLQAPIERIDYWASRLPARGMRIGLVWKGANRHKNDANRSIAELRTLAPLWNVSDTVFISLQKGQGEEEALSTRLPILPLGADIEDFADTAAIVSQLDLVICVDTAIAHLTGAINKPCWVLLPAIGVDWRWSHEREDNLWYPSLRLFRQNRLGEWGEVVDKLADALNELRLSRA